MSKTKETIRDTLIQLNFSAAAKTVSDDQDLFEAGAIDSLTLIQFVLAIEDQFQVRIENSDINYENFKTLEKLSDFLKSKYLKSA